MNLRCLLHVRPPSTPAKTEIRSPMPSLLDLDVEWVDESKPRGASIETWNRARGWSSED